MSVIDPGPDRYYGPRSPAVGSSGVIERSAPLDAWVPASLLVLLALGTGPLHAYGILRQVERDSGTLMGKDAVVGTVERLEEAGWVEPTEGSSTGRDRTFVMTSAGRNALRSEIVRIQRLAALARERRILP